MAHHRKSHLLAKREELFSRLGCHHVSLVDLLFIIEIVEVVMDELTQVQEDLATLKGNVEGFIGDVSVAIDALQNEVAALKQQLPNPTAVQGIEQGLANLSA